MIQAVPAWGCQAMSWICHQQCCPTRRSAHSYLCLHDRSSFGRVHCGRLRVYYGSWNSTFRVNVVRREFSISDDVNHPLIFLVLKLSQDHRGLFLRANLVHHRVVAWTLRNELEDVVCAEWGVCSVVCELLFEECLSILVFFIGLCITLDNQCQNDINLLLRYTIRRCGVWWGRIIRVEVIFVPNLFRCFKSQVNLDAMYWYRVNQLQVESVRRCYI